MSLRRILLLIVIFACVFTIIGSASDKIQGKIINKDGKPYQGPIIIERTDVEGKIWETSTDRDGNYEKDVGTESGADHPYKLSKKKDENTKYDGEDREVKKPDWVNDDDGSENHHCVWNPNPPEPPAPGIPEFPTVALPIAAVIGLVFLFNSKKRKEE